MSSQRNISEVTSRNFSVGVNVFCKWRGLAKASDGYEVETIRGAP